MEKAFIFGEKHTVAVTDADRRLILETVTGGVIWSRSMEAQDSLYRSGTGAPAIVNTDDNKRIIDLSATGTLSADFYRTLISRVFRKTNDKAYEKLCLCGWRSLKS
jgi:hypothetical protein